MVGASALASVNYQAGGYARFFDDIDRDHDGCRGDQEIESETSTGDSFLYIPYPG